MKKFSTTLFIFSLVLSMTGCGVFTQTAKAETEIIETPEPTQTVTAEAEDIPTLEEDAPEAPAAKMSSKVSQIKGEWIIIQVGATKIDFDEDMPYINFEAESGRFYANNGCNTINGSFVLEDNWALTFYNTLSTMRYCEDVRFDHDINVVLGEEEIFAKLENSGTDRFLIITDKKGKQLMKMCRNDLEFLNGNWAVVSIVGLNKLETESDIFFDVSELKIHGNTGCNYFNGDLYLDHRIGNAIDISNMTVSQIACTYSNQERALMVALEQSVTVTHSGDTVTFFDDGGKAVLTLKRK